MIKVFCFLLSLGLSQSLAVLGNTQKDFAIKPIVSKKPSNLYIPSGLQQIAIDTESQPAASEYNRPSYQYFPAPLKSEVIFAQKPNVVLPSQSGFSQYQSLSDHNSVLSNNNIPSHQYLPSSSSSSQGLNIAIQPQNGLSQYQPTFAHNSPPSNYNGPSHQYSQSSSKQEVTTSLSSNLVSSSHNDLNQYQQNSAENTLPTNYNEASYQDLSTSSKQDLNSAPGAQRPNIAQQPQNGGQYQPTSAQYSLTTNYNGVSYQYSPTSSQKEVPSTPNSNGPELSQYQPTFAQNSFPPNHNVPFSSKPEITTTPRSEQPSPPSKYYGPPHQYFPTTPELDKNTTPLPIAIGSQNPENVNNPIKNQRPQQILINNLLPNEQPPIELHQGYRYIEPAQKINITNFQTITGVKYNELGLGENDTSRIPQQFRPSKTEIETQQGYVYGPHYPNTTVLMPVTTLESSNIYHQQKYPNGLGSHNSLNKTQVNGNQLKYQQQEKQPQQQYPNHRYSNKELLLTTSTDIKPIEQTFQHSNHKKLTITSSNTEPSNGTTTSSHSENCSNKVNHLTSPQTESNRFTTESTQQMATQIYPHLYKPNEIGVSNTISNQYYTSGNQQFSHVVSQVNPLNYEPFNRVPSAASAFNNIQTPSSYIDNTIAQQFIVPNQNPQNTKPSFITNVQNSNNQHPPAQSISDGSANRQPQANALTQVNQFETELNRYSSQSTSQTSSTSSLSPSITASNNIPNVQTQFNRYAAISSISNPSRQSQETFHYNQYYSTPSQQHSQGPLAATTANSGPGFQNQSSSHSTQVSNQIQQNIDSQRYYVITSQHPSQAATQQPTYPTSQNQQPSQVSIFKPNVPTQTATQQPIYPTNQNPQLSQAPNFNLNVQTQDDIQQPSYPSNQNQENTVTNYMQRPSSIPTAISQNGYYSTNPQQSTPTHTNSISSNIRPNGQTESNPIYSTTHPSQEIQNNYDSSHYYNTSPQQINRTPLRTPSSNTKPIIPSGSQQFFPSTPQKSAQRSYHSSNMPITPVESSQGPTNQVFFPPQKSFLHFPQTSLTSKQLFSNSNNLTSSLTETPRFTPAKQSLYQNQQFFLAKPTQTSQNFSTNTVSNFFGQTSAVPHTASLSASNNANLIPQTSEHKPVNIMGNSNYLQMQSHSFEIPYFYSPPTATTESQHNYVESRATVPVEPVRLPHLIYGAPVNKPSTTYLPPDLVIKTPYY